MPPNPPFVPHAGFSERLHKREQVDGDVFREILEQAVALLNGTGLPPEEVDEQRERLLAGFRWILVDEYQDIGPKQYELIAALAGHTVQDKDGKLSLFAVGDDDQNIYAFDGALVEFIGRFEQTLAVMEELQRLTNLSAISVFNHPIISSVMATSCVSTMFGTHMLIEGSVHNPDEINVPAFRAACWSDYWVAAVPLRPPFLWTVAVPLHPLCLSLVLIYRVPNQYHLFWLSPTGLPFRGKYF